MHFYVLNRALTRPVHTLRIPIFELLLDKRLIERRRRGRGERKRRRERGREMHKEEAKGEWSNVERLRKRTEERRKGTIKWWCRTIRSTIDRKQLRYLRNPLIWVGKPHQNTSALCGGLLCFFRRTRMSNELVNLERMSRKGSPISSRTRLIRLKGTEWREGLIRYG